eukprot:sb/3479181/
MADKLVSSKSAQLSNVPDRTQLCCRSLTAADSAVIRNIRRCIIVLLLENSSGCSTVSGSLIQNNKNYYCIMFHKLCFPANEYSKRSHSLISDEIC